MTPTIIKLGPNTSGNPISVSTFEEAFGEYSELRGRGRARRAKRKASKQATRQQKRMTRIGNRSERKKARQTMRADQQESRQVRKDVRKSRKVARKGMGDTEDEMDNQTAIENGSSEQEQGGGGEYSQDQGNGQGESQTTEDSNIQNAEQEAEQGEEQGEEQSEEQGDAEGDSEGDGVMSEDDSSFSGELNPNKAVNPKVRECAKKIEWNKELIARLELRKKRLNLALQNATNSRDIAKIKHEIETIDTQIAERSKRIADLEAMLSEYSNASGRRSAPKRNAEVKQAKKMARQERAKVSVQSPNKGTSKGQARRMARRGVETPVESDLNAEMDENRIEVPAQGTGNADEGNFDGIGTPTGRGLIAMDSADDYDTPETNIIELKSNASGSTTADKSKRNKQILIGVGLGVLVIAGLYYANKKGLFKSK